MPTECRKGAPGGWSAIAVATVVLGLLPPDLVAQGLRERRPIGSGWIQDRHAELPAAARLVVSTKGDITIAGSSRESIRYAARLRVRAPGDGTEWVQAALGSSGIEALEREDGALELSLIEPECAGCRLDASVEIQIPESTVEIDLRTPFGDIRVSNVRGSVRALADGGSVDLESIGGAVDVIAAGSVRLENVSGPVNCETRSGRVEVGRVTGPASLRTSVGSLRVESVQGDLDAATGAGSIQVGRVSGTARLATSSGSIQVGDALNGLEADVGAGDIRVRRVSGTLNLTSGTGNIAVALQEGTRLRDSVLSTGVGSVVVSLPESLALTVEAAVQLVKGRQGIVSDFPAIRIRRLPGLLGGSGASGSINGGGPVLRSRTGIGHVEIRRQR